MARKKAFMGRKCTNERCRVIHYFQNKGGCPGCAMGQLE